MKDRFAVLLGWMLGLVLFSAAGAPRLLIYLECLDCIVGVDILQMDLGKALHQPGHGVTQIHEVADPSAWFGHGQDNAQRFKRFGLLAMFMVNQRQDVDTDIPAMDAGHLRIHFL